jgi:hypothetical protein
MSRHPRLGLTLVEMLVAMTASLILFGAVLTIFDILGETVSKSRRTGRLEADLCSLRLQLQQDLAGITANRDAKGLLCEVDSGSVTGYFNAIEGPNSDLIDYLLDYPPPVPAGPFNRDSNAPGPTAQSDDRIVGDTDDMLFFTARSAANAPFLGKAGATTVSASQAEVAYFCTPTPRTSSPRLYTLHRRQLLITGGTNSPHNMPFTTWKSFYSQYDLSARRELDGSGNSIVRLNTANDLQQRRNRFAHDPLCSGTNLALYPLAPRHPDNVLALTDSRANDDVIATNVLAFDVRLLDPLAVERQSPNLLRMQPSDQLYANAANVATSTAVYGDLGFNSFVAFHNGNAAPGIFSGYGRAGHILAGSATTSRTYDTWSSFYRTNNQDDDGQNGADDPGERPPYAEQVAGIQVILRLYDADTRTVKQATITSSFRK